MSAFLFAYGTLQPEFAPSAIAHVVARLDVVGRGCLSGVLYDLGGYPGAVLETSSQRRINGTVLQLPEDANVLHAIDAYEEFDPRSPETSPFIRVLHAVVLDGGQTLQCWVYLCNRIPASARILLDGTYRR